MLSRLRSENPKPLMGHEPSTNDVDQFALSWKWRPNHRLSGRPCVKRSLFTKLLLSVSEPTPDLPCPAAGGGAALRVSRDGLAARHRVRLPHHADIVPARLSQLLGRLRRGAVRHGGLLQKVPHDQGLYHWRWTQQLLHGTHQDKLAQAIRLKRWPTPPLHTHLQVLSVSRLR